MLTHLMGRTVLFVNAGQPVFMDPFPLDGGGLDLLATSDPVSSPSPLKSDRGRVSKPCPGEESNSKKRSSEEISRWVHQTNP